MKRITTKSPMALTSPVTYAKCIGSKPKLLETYSYSILVLYS